MNDPNRTGEYEHEAPTQLPAPAPLDASSSDHPRQIGRYRVEKILGQGGFGLVYLAHDDELQRLVAIKMPHRNRVPRRSGRAADRGRALLQEARNLARLRHPGIVAVHDVGVYEGGVYIVSDYLDGPDLGRWLRDNRPFRLNKGPAHPR